MVIEPVDIKYSKWKPLRFVVPLLVAVPVVTYSVYFTERWSDNPYIKYWLPLLNVWAIYIIYKPIKILIDNKPPLSLTAEYLETNVTGESKKYRWADIIGVAISKGERDVDILKIKTQNTVDEIDVTPLEKTPDEIRDLIASFRDRH